MRTDILGVLVSAIDMSMALEAIEGWIRSDERQYVCVTGVHGVMESQRDPALRDVHNRAGLVTPDGMPLVWINRLRGLRWVRRVYGPDLMLAVCERSIARGWRHFFYGGAPGVAELLVQRLRERLPGLEVAGVFSPPFSPGDEKEDAAMVERINATTPQVVWVGLSTPKQERWMAAHVNRLHANVLVGVGAAFDFLAGLKPQAPLWMQRNGLEWSFRLASEPRRLWRRYLFNNPAFVGKFVLNALRNGPRVS